MIAQITNEVCFYAEKLNAPDAVWSSLPTPPENASAVVISNYSVTPADYCWIRFDGDTSASIDQGFVLAAGATIVIKGSANVINTLVIAPNGQTTSLMVHYFKG